MRTWRRLEKSILVSMKPIFDGTRLKKGYREPSTSFHIPLMLEALRKILYRRQPLLFGFDLAEKVVFIDCMTAGVSGDMMLGALVDLYGEGSPLSEVAEVIEGKLSNVKSVRFSVGSVLRREIAAKRVEVQVEESGRMTGVQLKDALEVCARDLNLSHKASSFASSVLGTLLDAERRVHGEFSGDIELDELGSADTLFDILGASHMLQKLNLFENTVFYSSPVSVGGGFVKFSHGRVAAPAPATLEILKSKGFPVVGQNVDGELTTPTGAALVVSLAEKALASLPLFKVLNVGYGAGFKDFSGFPNVTRILVGERFEDLFGVEEVYVLETNLDDVTGETLGYLMERLFKEGAKDVCFIPVFAKKNRPAHIVRVIADEVKKERLMEALFEETGTLGVRMERLHRCTLSRETLNVTLPAELGRETVRVKVARDSAGRVVNVKPEYDDVKAVAEKTGKPFRVVWEMAERAFKESCR